MVNKHYILSVTYGDYRDSIGGTDKVVLAHQQLFNQRNISYVVLFPLNISHSKPLKKNPFWGIICDGNFEGVYYTDSVIKYLDSLGKNDNICQCIHIHHLRNVNIPHLRAILKVLRTTIYFYVHDYYNICVSTNLIRSDTKILCHGNLNDSLCKNCSYYKNAMKHRKSFEELMSEIGDRCTFICPSDAAASQFMKSFPQYGSSVKVVYHQKFIGKYSGNKKVTGKLKIAYVGSQLAHKGWTLFLELVSQFIKSGNFEFFYFGKKEIADKNIRHIDVEFKDNLNDMVDALRKYEIDCVVLWSVWPETYAYTYYEAFAANCYILTNCDSGNIGFQVQSRKNGLVCETKEQLFSLFLNFADLRKQIVDFKMNYSEAPNALVENDEIFKLSADDREFKVVDQICPKRNLVIEWAERAISFLYRCKRKK